jgi:cobalt-zinc-cadmium efflux system membrane fusion protein
LKIWKQKLITGMFVEAAIVVDSKKAMAIPIEALITENNKTLYFYCKRKEQ